MKWTEMLYYTVLNRNVLVAVWELRMFLPESLMLAHLMDTFMAHVSSYMLVLINNNR